MGVRSFERGPLGMSVGARVFVTIVFTILGASFLVTTWSLYTEFQSAGWFELATLYSHVFIFFPTFGILALCAFYIPASAFVDLYWRHVTLGRLRFLVGLIAVSALSYVLSEKIMAGDVPALWWLKPETLTADRGSPAGCDAAAGACRRVAILDAVAKIREESTQRVGLSRFVRNCKPDPLVEPLPENTAKRFCFANQAMATAQECCNAKAAFTEDLRRLYRRPAAQSETQRVHELLLPLKVFFLLTIFVIGLLLAAWRRSIDKYYAPFAQRIERGIIVGALAMLVWPISNHAYLQSASLVYSSFGEGFYKAASPIFSLMFGCWALMIVLFYFRGEQRDIEAAGKIGGGVASAVAVLNYDRIIDFAERTFGSGAQAELVIAVIVVLALAFVALLWTANKPEAATTVAESKPAKRPRDQAVIGSAEAGTGATGASG
jgi:hypothetical protein